MAVAAHKPEFSRDYTGIANDYARKVAAGPRFSSVYVELARKSGG